MGEEFGVEGAGDLREGGWSVGMVFDIERGSGRTEVDSLLL